MTSPPLVLPILEVLGLDPESSLDDIPRFLIDPCFLASLHLELVAEVGLEQAGAALLQLGFVHGLYDAASVVREGIGPRAQAAASVQPRATRLPMQLQPIAPGALELRGHWPQGQEARAIREASDPSDTPICFASMGYTSGWASGIFGTDMLCLEMQCQASGARVCAFQTREAAAWRASGDPRAIRLLDALPFDAFRDLVGRKLAASHPSEPDDRFDESAPVIHVWGPVMVIPFSGVDEALRAVELIGRDPGARDVRVIVVDLTGTIVDEAYGAVALEQILSAIESWGAEPVLAGVSPLSEPVVQSLEKDRLVVRKDLPDAIATGFQIAEALRSSV